MPNEPQSITVSLEWAKKLKEAGYEQNSVFWWLDHGRHVESWRLYPKKKLSPWSSKEGKRYYAAPTAEEILMKLPVQIKEEELRINHGPIDGEPWYIAYTGTRGVSDFSLANAAASMFCYLASNKLL